MTGIEYAKLTFVDDCDGLLSNGGAWSLLGLGIEIKLVACAVLEVGQRDACLIGCHCELRQWAQLIAAIDWGRGT